MAEAQGKTLPSAVGLYNKKFDIALLLDRTRKFQNDVTFNTKGHKKLLITTTEDDLRTAEVGVLLLPKLFKALFANRNSIFCTSKLINSLLKLSYEFLSQQKDHLFSNSSKDLQQVIKTLQSENKKKIKFPQLLIKLFNFNIELTKLLETVSRYNNIGLKYMNNNYESLRQDLIVKSKYLDF